MSYLTPAQAAAQPLPGGRADFHVNQGAGFAAAIRGTAGLADFDGDSRTDIAFAKPRGLVNGVFHYQVEVILSAQPRATLVGVPAKSRLLAGGDDPSVESGAISRGGGSAPGISRQAVRLRVTRGSDHVPCART